ncbi:endonuclease/exonuclease/phosphatase family protein [Lysobacter sp. CAU 1642]|uniref:Endonuclease/exonuclease/phosphatase family protein n=2 Tax=Pseudomarimonas salicorniae TaxID=2933270 RepID=A0ABT0GJF7_9GAMM|nr:endonuclease/exonuclease/phosphatase family protein [Lysobacter sp. CAU 1642]MCK7594150.1 endonuclease/exonuclease/phosphatase family protein [Lysobacter sp. CAU 1642]
MKVCVLIALLLLGAGEAVSAPPAALRIATFNASLNDDAGRLPQRLREGHEPARHAAAILQRVRPDIVLINEFDHDPEGLAAHIFRQRYLGRSQAGDAPLDYPHAYAGPVNTGVPSGLDINGDGKVEGPNDAWGFGRHPGQFGMLLLSRHPIDAAALRSFRRFAWSRLPDASRPHHPDGRPLHSDAVWAQLRLSSKSHWDVPVATPFGTLHLLAAHPTPPVFDGPENLNGLRNHDELKLWKHYLDGGEQSWLCDDQGRCGGLPAGRAFVIIGDLNADPQDGDTQPGAVQQLTSHPRVLDYPAPRSDGGRQATDRGPPKRTDPATHTAQFGARTGNMRVDYVLPSVDFEVVASGVFWPTGDQPEAAWLDCSDHRLVWVDLRPAKPR